MKNFTTPLKQTALFAAAFVLASFIPRSESPETFYASQTLASNWERAKAYTKEYLDAAPEEMYSFQPTAEMRTFGQQMMHIAEANYGISAVAAGKTPPITFGQLEKSDKAKSKAEVTKAVMESYDFAIANAKGLNDIQMQEMVKLFNFDMNRGTAMEKAFEHQTHHRGQTTVYLRLKGVTPPAEKLF
ncbi:MAG TPA: DinB family protein [Ohtaekwangia sp.]|uniref:DinB family protein n=1 Tax=Ohtaekwangia sp. TaxID=2066019 RepID=UPI002F93BE8C